MLLRFLFYIFALTTTLFTAAGAQAQEYPNKPIRMIASGMGGGTDFSARLIAQTLSGSLGHQVIVENRPDNVAQETVAKAPPDGYTIFATGTGFWITPLIQKTSYDPIKDFAPITLATRNPNVLVVHPSLPVKSVKELIALAKANPGALNFSSAGTGGAAHLAAELFRSMAGVNMVHVPYKGGGPALLAVLSGQVHLIFANAAAVAPHIKSDKLRPLAVSSARPSALAPDLPTIAAAGLPGYEAVSMVSIFAPAKTPAAIINRLNQEIVRAINRPDVKDKFFAAGVEVAGSTPEELAATIKAEMERMGKVIKEAGIRGE